MYKELSKEVKKTFEANAEKPPKLDIAPVIHELLQGKNIRQLALEVGLPRTEIYHILAGRKKYPGLEALRKLSRSLGMELWRLIALAEGRKNENVYFGGHEPEFTSQFKKDGILLSSDTPPNKNIFVGRLVLNPGAELSDQLTSHCVIYLRPTTGSIEVTVGNQTSLLHVNDKTLFNGRLPHRIKNPSKVNKTTCLFITTPAFWSLSLTN